MERTSGVTGKKNKRILYTVIVAMLLLGLLITLIGYIYTNTKEEGLENLHIQTKDVKDDFELQMISDTENLFTIANLASKLYTEGEQLDPIVLSFEEIGLIENIGFLLPDNVILTKVGRMKAPEELNFKEEVARETYISGIVEDMTLPGRNVIRIAIPVEVEDKVVAILYGMINAQDLEERLLENAAYSSTQIFVIDRTNGKFIVNTISNKFEDISVFEDREFREGYNYKDFKRNILSGEKGFSAFVSKVEKGRTFYLHYSPLDIVDWEIVLAEPEDSVFMKAHQTGMMMVLLFAGIVIIMSAYLIVIFASETKLGKLHRCTTKIRKLLLEVNQDTEKIRFALKNMTEFTSARSAIFVDTDGEDYGVINPLKGNEKLNNEDRAYFMSRLLNYAGAYNKERGTGAAVVTFRAEGPLKYQEPEFYEFMTKHNQKSIVFAGITNKHNHVSILALINPENIVMAQELIREIAVCFSMAIYNKKYLAKTETVAATDSLTGLSNRMAYKKDIKKYDEENTENFSCLYVDVNELHDINNRYGHAAGDGMLLFIANTLKEVFSESNIYRIGGDEFLVFTEKTPEDEIRKKIETVTSKVEEMNYYISVGLEFCKRNVDTEAMVSLAEKRMYEAKARYYQKKEKRILEEVVDNDIERVSTGMRDVDALLTIMSKRYHGVYSVAMDGSSAHSILMPAHLNKFAKDEHSFKRAFTYYVEEMVHPDDKRAMMAFLNFEVIRDTLVSGSIPSIEYRKVSGERVVLSVYPIQSSDRSKEETIWVFENMD